MKVRFEIICDAGNTHLICNLYISEKLNTGFFPFQTAYSKSGMAFLTC